MKLRDADQFMERSVRIHEIVIAGQHPHARMPCVRDDRFGREPEPVEVEQGAWHLVRGRDEDQRVVARALQQRNKFSK